MSSTRVPLQGEADANGNASVSATCPTGQQWVITQVAVTSNSATVTEAALTVNGQLVCATGSGNADTAGGSPSIPVRSGETFSVLWANCTPGSQVGATLYYDVVG